MSGNNSPGNAGGSRGPSMGMLGNYTQPYTGMTQANGSGGYALPSPDAASSSMAPPTPPNNPTPAVMPPSPPPQAQSWSPYGGGDEGFWNRRGNAPELPPDRVPWHEQYRGGFNPFGRREQAPGVPTWSQGNGVYHYDPNGRPGGFGGGPFGWLRGFGGEGWQMPDFGNIQQRMQEFTQRMQEHRPHQPEPSNGPTPGSPMSGLGAINPYENS